DGDGCSSSCRVEPQPDNSGDGWMCPTPGQPCVRTDCGDGVVEGTEQCDLGHTLNNEGGHGCTPFCRLEPSCPVAGGSCTSACGDGILLREDAQLGHECDDGNTIDGDGCSSNCKLEPGYTCTEVVEGKSEMILPIVFRDFLHYDETG